MAPAHKLSLAAFDEQADAYDSAVSCFPGIDTFCSRSDWIIPFHRACLSDCPVYILRSKDSFVVFTKIVRPDGMVFFTPLEPSWCFPSPLVGPDSPELLKDAVCGNPAAEGLSYACIQLSGLPDDQRFILRLAHLLRSRFSIFPGQSTVRRVASLEGGLDGYLSRRSKKFRTNIARALRQAAERGIRFRRVSAAAGFEGLDSVYDRVVDIESRSWKGLSGQGVNTQPLREFYRLVIRRTGARGALRLIFACHEHSPVGYIYGACSGQGYRGFQFSFDRNYASCSLGNVLQYRMLEWLSEEGWQRYDMGAHAPYKEKWAEQEHRTLSFFLMPH